MNIDYLKSFYYVAELNSISKASKKLYISQPGLSMQLKKLEEDIGHKLLTRSNQGVLLTSIGEEVFSYAKSIFDLEENLYKKIENLNLKKDKLVVAACKNFGSFYFASKVHKFKEIYENSKVTLDTYNSSVVMQKVMNHEYNIGIIAEYEEMEKSKEVDIESFFDDELVLCSKFNFHKNSIGLDELEKIPLILREENSNSFLILRNFFNSANLNFEKSNILFTCNCTNIIKNTIINENGFSFLPKSSIIRELKFNLIKIIEIKSEKKLKSLKFGYSIVKRKQYDLNFYEKKFREILQEI
jgi:DNA-binding transcriptional LysR family regulator